MLIPKWGED